MIDKSTLFVEDEFGEVPLYNFLLRKLLFTGGLADQPGEKRMRVIPFDFHFSRQREVHPETALTEFLNARFRARFLSAKVVAGTSQHDHFILEMRVQFLQLRILSRKSAF